MVILVIIVILAFLVFWIIGVYNKLVLLKNTRENAFADIDVQLKQRNDLIPQLVETVKGYAFHEKDVLTRITEARSAAMSATTIEEKVKADNQLTSALQGLKVQVEAYPDLKANTNFMQLQEEIADIENKLAAARRYFNASTKELNTAIESFPGNMIAARFGFSRQTMFDLGTDKRTQLDEPPKINFTT
ncbi:MAG TPA: LemA family protein [Bacteroidia bacterium]|nr:LemA family protein [Bacteroidia bacterium]